MKTHIDNPTEAIRRVQSMESLLNPQFYIDFYKIGHIDQYHHDVRAIYSTWTPRYAHNPQHHEYVTFGNNVLFKEHLIRQFDQNFFARDIDEVLAEYKRVVKHCLFIDEPRTDHIQALWELGYLPLRIYALPEGTVVPHNLPVMVITNTKPEFFWLVNYVETLMSSVLWKMGTSASTARRFRKLFEYHAKRAGETDLSFVDWQGHDFSFRGMCGPEDAIRSGMGHLLSFTGTDTVPAILAAEAYYGANIEKEIVGASVPATEHSVMCAGLQDGEFETFQRLLTETYPKGIVSIVSDTWDLWKVLCNYIPRLKNTILARDGKLVIRPDSGNPVTIMCGDPAVDPLSGYPRFLGAVRLLALALGTSNNPTGKLPLITKGGVIYGDGISEERANEILTRVVGEARLSPYNVVFGIGSYTYQYCTRDSHGMALKAVAYKDSTGAVVPMFKKPVTDDGRKNSHKGICAPFRVTDDLVSLTGSKWVLKQEASEEMLNNCAYERVFEDSNLLVDPTWAEVKARARA